MEALLTHAPVWCGIVAILIAVALAPPLEEFLFRGILLHGFTDSYGPRAAAIMVTSLFVLAHLPEIGTYGLAAAIITVVAIGELVARVRTGSLAPSVAMHAAYNCGVAAFAYLWMR